MTLQTGCKHNHWFNWFAETHHMKSWATLHECWLTWKCVSLYNINKLINPLLLYNQNKAKQMHIDARKASKAGRKFNQKPPSVKQPHQFHRWSSTYRTITHETGKCDQEKANTVHNCGIVLTLMPWGHPKTRQLPSGMTVVLTEAAAGIWPLKTGRWGQDSFKLLKQPPGPQRQTGPHSSTVFTHVWHVVKHLYLLR